MIRLAMALLGLFSIPLSAQRPPCPASPGVFYLDGDAWKPMELVSPSGVTGSGRAMVTYSEESTFFYRNVAAPITLRQHPTFCAFGTMTTARNVLILRLTQKEDHRELQIGKTSALGRVKMAHHPQDIQPVHVVLLGDHSLEIAPKEDLKPGQYLLVPPGPPMFLASRGYGFGVR